jgi:signal peptide peptidase SppA
MKEYNRIPDWLMNMLTFYGSTWDWDVLVTVRTPQVPMMKTVAISPRQMSWGWSKRILVIENMMVLSKKPTVAMIRQQGLSAAYWAATGAQHIFASKNSDVGSIGVTMSYLDNVGKNKKDGNDYVQLSAGKYKDAGDPDKALTDEEKQLLLRDVNIMHENFIANVAANRGISVVDVQKIADGSSVLGDRAKALHLIDDIGGMPEVESYLQNLIGEKPSVCWQ